MNRSFPLKTADLVIPNHEARGLWMDFRMLRQVATNDKSPTSSLSPKALRACNEIMNTFRRVPGDAQDATLACQRINRCRQIAAEVLGSLDQGLVTNQAYRADHTNVWAIGHW